MNIFFLIISIISFAGFLLALYIYSTKNKNESLVCPLEGSCDAVVTSQYSRFLGFPVEVMGMVYYGFTAGIYLLIFLNIISYTSLASLVMVLLGVSGGLFSIYLISIQAFVLRQWCTWCVVSAFLSLIIMIFSIFVSEMNFVSIFAQYRSVVVILHALVAALGVGGAIITDIFFFKFLKDYRIAGDESETLKTFSQIMWVALTGLILTGLALFLTDPEKYIISSKFLTKMIAVLVIGVNGGVLNLIISPKIQDITFGGEHAHRAGELSWLRKVAFASGSISISSWLLVFVLGSIRSIPYTVFEGIGLYILVLIFAVAGSQVYARFLSRV